MSDAWKVQARVPTCDGQRAYPGGSKPRVNPSSEIARVCVTIRVRSGQTRSKTHDKVGDQDWVDLNLSILTWLHRTGSLGDANLVNQSVYAT